MRRPKLVYWMTRRALCQHRLLNTPQTIVPLQEVLAFIKIDGGSARHFAVQERQEGRIIENRSNGLERDPICFSSFPVGVPVVSKNTNELKTGAPGRFDRHRPVASPRSGACRRRCRRFEFPVLCQNSALLK